MKSIAIVALTLSLGGFVAGAAEGDAKPKLTPAPSLPEWAKQYDKNGDGKLDQEERAAATKARREEILKKYDKNGNGKLDPEEAQARNEDLRKEREQHKADLEKKKDDRKEEKKLEKKEEKKDDKK